MKNTILLIIVAINCHAQTFTSGFDTFTLQPGSYYKDTNNLPFEAANALFSHEWTKGSFPYWSGGFSYTNDYDSTTAGYTNLYGVIPYKGYNGSPVYVVGQDKGLIRLKAPGGLITGFYVTNTTYAYKSMKYGDGIAKKFGGSSGTDPDFFKLVIKGYRNGVMKSDSVEFYLADFRSSTGSQDYIVNTWQFVNTAVMSEVDSLRFLMRSSDAGQFGINTPLFFGLDEFSVTYSNVTGAGEEKLQAITVYPNPFRSEFTVRGENPVEMIVRDITGQTVLRKSGAGSVSTGHLSPGVYFLEMNDGNGVITKKIIKSNEQ